MFDWACRETRWTGVKWEREGEREGRGREREGWSGETRRRKKGRG